MNERFRRKTDDDKIVKRVNHDSGWVAYNNTRLSFLINKLTNIEFTVRLALLEAPIAYSLRLDYVFNWKKSSL